MKIFCRKRASFEIQFIADTVEKKGTCPGNKKMGCLGEVALRQNFTPKWYRHLIVVQA